MFSIFAILRLSGYPVNKAQKYFRSIEKIEDKLSWQKEQRWNIFSYHLINNPNYRKFIKSEVRNWEDIPILKKENLRVSVKDLLPVGLKKRNIYFGSTSGSTGTPMNFARNKLFHVLVWLSALTNYEKDGILFNDLEARFYGIPISGLKKIKEKIKDLLSNRYRFVFYDLSDEIFIKWLYVFKKKRFKYIYGYTNSIIQFAKFLEKNNIVLSDVCPTLKRCIVTSETCDENDYVFLKRQLGIPVSNEYGASEVCVIGYRREKVWEVSDELLFLEVVDENGNIIRDEKPGRLLCTLLHNKGMPVIRYDIGDIVSLKRSSGKTYITSLQGRSNDMCLLSSGKKVPGLTFYYAVREALQNEKDIKEHQVVQLSKEKIEVRIVTDSVLSSDIVKKVQSAFKVYLKDNIKIDVIKVAKIDRTKSGKFKHFINKMDNK